MSTFSKGDHDYKQEMQMEILSIGGTLWVRA